MSIWCHKKITERACTRNPRQNNNNSGNGDGTIPFRLWVIYYEKISFEIYRKDPNSKWLHITDWICSSSYLIKCISFILKMKQTFIETQSGEQCGTIELRLFFLCVLFHRCTYGWLAQHKFTVILLKICKIVFIC